MHTIMGIGIDIVETDRIRRAVDKNHNFLKRIFTDAEIEYFSQKALSPESIAGGFAAKEAVSKAIGTGIRKLSFRDIEISRDSLGKPCVCMVGRLLDICTNAGIDNIMVSISHSKSYAVANAIALKNSKL